MDQPKYTQEQVNQAISALSVDEQQLVLGSLREQTEVSERERTELQFLRSIRNFGLVYERTTNSRSSDSNIGSWIERLYEESENLLSIFGSRSKLSEAQQVARDTAATIYVYSMLENGRGEVNEDLLERSGANRETILYKFRQPVRIALIEEGSSPEDAATTVLTQFTNFSDFSGTLDPENWDAIVEPQAMQMRGYLLEAGYGLPELNEDGKYNDEDTLPE